MIFRFVLNIIGWFLDKLFWMAIGGGLVFWLLRYYLGVC